LEDQIISYREKVSSIDQQKWIYKRIA